jgi:hypothetical protein
LWRVEEPVTEDPGAQQIEVAEQELIEGKLFPWSIFYPIMFFNITYSYIGFILMGPNGHPSLFIHFTLFIPESLG